MATTLAADIAAAVRFACERRDAFKRLMEQSPRTKGDRGYEGSVAIPARAQKAPVPAVPMRERRAFRADINELHAARSTARHAWFKAFEPSGVPEALREQIDEELLWAAMGTADATREEMDELFEQTEAGLNPEERDFAFDRDTSLTPRGRVTQLTANLAAINLLKTLEAEDRLPSPEEKTVLSEFSGFGGHKEVFNASMANYRLMSEQQRGFYGFYGSWEKEYGRWFDAFKEVLTEEEWRSAEASVLNAHYTDEGICHRLWDAAKQLGLKGGKILEPTVGVGNFLGSMPPEIRNNAEVVGVELDSLTARIAQKLYPQASIEESALQEAQTVPRNSFSFAITNVPFSDIKPGNQNFPVPLNLHNYCIARTLNALEPGGVAVLITSASTMENNGKERDFLVSRLELLGAIRLPNSAFARNAGTEVVTDILIVRKPDGEKRMGEAWSAVLPLSVAEGEAGPGGRTAVTVNEYFHRHPEMVLGQHSLKGRMYGAAEEGQYTVKFSGTHEELLAALDQAIGRLPSNVMQAARAATLAGGEAEEGAQRLMAFRDEKEGNIVVRVETYPAPGAATATATATVSRERVLTVGARDEDGNRALEQPQWWNTDFKLPRRFSVEEADNLARDYVGLRQAVKAVIFADLEALTTEEASAGNRAELNRTYDGFVLRWGKVNENPAIDRLLGSDPDFGSVAALEVARTEAREGKKVVVHDKATIFAQRTVFPFGVPQKADSIADGINISLNVKGRVEAPYVAQLVGLPQDVEGVKKLILDTGLVFEDPDSGALEHRVSYLAGDVLTKVVRARAAAESESRFSPNVTALEAVLPESVKFEQITVQLGAPWVPLAITNEFLTQAAGSNGKVEAFWLKNARKWYLPTQLSWSESAAAQYATPRVSLRQVFESALGQQAIKVYDELDEKTRVFNGKESAKANERVAKLGEDFVGFIKADANRMAQVEVCFNEHFNRVRLPEHSGAYLTFPGLAQGPGSMEPRPHQRDVTARLIAEQAGVIAHAVGYGKTFELILVAMESRRLGLAQKPMIVCDNPSYPQFVATLRQCYPQANILVSSSESVNEKNRDRFISQVATGAWDVVVMAQSHFDRIPNSPDTEMKHVNRQIEELRRTKEELSAHSGRKQLERSIAKALASEEQKLIARMKKLRERGDDCSYWESMGVDLLLVDEAHKYKKLPFSTNHRNVKGIDTTRSQRGERLLMKALQIQERRDGKGVILATGTPVTNTMAETWNMVRASHPKVAESFSVETFDEFVSFCCQKVTGMELNESSGKWKNVERLAKFFNGPSFVQFVRSGMDVKMDASVVKLDVPALKGGQIELCVVNQTDSVADLMAGISEIYEEYERSSGADKQALCFIPIMLMQVGMAASIDPRLIDPTLPDEPESLVNQAIEDIFRVWTETAANRSTQAVFLDRYNPMNTTALEAVQEGGLKAYTAEYEESEEESSAERAVMPEVEYRGRWNLYSEIRAKLVARGVPLEEVAIVGDAKSDEERKAMFEKVNAGDVRVIIGSSKKLGTGVNIQRKLIKAHHLDPAGDLTPASMTQRNGRIIRQGNENAEVAVVYYGMKDTATPGIYHRLQRKDAFIAQVFAAKGVGSEFEDCGELRLEEMKACLISDKRQLHRAELIASIREARLKAEMASDRQRSLAHSVNLLARRVDSLERASLPRTIQTAKWMQLNVRPVDVLRDEEEVTIDYPGAKLPYVGPLKGGVKLLTEVIEKWKKEYLSGALKQLGTISIGGLRMRVTKELESFSSSGGGESGRPKAVLKVEVPHPTLPNWLLGDTQVQFATPQALFKVLRTRYDAALSEPTSLRTSLEHMQRERADIDAQLAAAPAPDLARVKGLLEELETLEADMRDNPMVRRGRAAKETQLSRPSATTAAAAASGEEPELTLDVEPPPPVLRVKKGAGL